MKGDVGYIQLFQHGGRNIAGGIGKYFICRHRAIPPFEIYKIDFELVFLSVYFTLYFGRCQ